MGVKLGGTGLHLCTLYPKIDIWREQMCALQEYKVHSRGPVPPKGRDDTGITTHALMAHLAPLPSPPKTVDFEVW